MMRTTGGTGVAIGHLPREQESKTQNSVNLLFQQSRAVVSRTRVFTVVLLVIFVVILGRSPPQLAGSDTNAAAPSTETAAVGPSVRLAQAKKSSVCMNADFVPSAPVAIMTMLVTGGEGDYVTGGEVLGASIQKHVDTSAVDQVYLEIAEKPLTPEARSRLEQQGWRRCVVPLIEPKRLPWMKRYQEQFTKLHLIRMDFYKTVLYIDADALVVGSLDELMRTKLPPGKRLGVSKDIYGGKWVNSFNMGVAFLHPDVAEADRLMGLLDADSVTYDTSHAEQGWLNAVYKDQWHDIGFQYNANLAAYSQDRKTWDMNANTHGLRIIHYTMHKPWDCKPPNLPVCEQWKTAQTEMTKS